jgi:hypothetical protein
MTKYPEMKEHQRPEQYHLYREWRETKQMQDAMTSIVPNDIDKHVTHHYADNNGVHIHYVSEFVITEYMGATKNLTQITRQKIL